MKNKKYCGHCEKYNLITSKCMIDNSLKNPDDICDKKKADKGGENDG
ncbi:MAG: hypothetical protein K0R54_5304 [Clostridiaceae bacterium]|jgi:hypothetical protein|nr:hypothetical protein [Clostridiaceae bacterium]